MREPNQDKQKQQARRIKILEDFYQMNGIDPHDAVALSMHFIALKSAGVAQYKFIETLFRKIWDAVEKGEL